MGFKLWIAEDDHKDFPDHIARISFTDRRITQDLQGFKDVRRLTDELKPDEWHLMRRYASTNGNKIAYTFITQCQQAVKLTAEWARNRTN